SARTRAPRAGARTATVTSVTVTTGFRQAERGTRKMRPQALKAEGYNVGTKERQMGVESHYSSKKNRVFVRAITGHYKLKDELARLRALPRVRKGNQIKFIDGPQAYS